MENNYYRRPCYSACQELYIEIEDTDVHYEGDLITVDELQEAPSAKKIERQLRRTV